MGTRLRPESNYDGGLGVFQEFGEDMVWDPRRMIEREIDVS